MTMSDAGRPRVCARMETVLHERGTMMMRRALAYIGQIDALKTKFE
jgi:hypothetical protein